MVLMCPLNFLVNKPVLHNQYLNCLGTYQKHGLLIHMDETLLNFCFQVYIKRLKDEGVRSLFIFI